MTAATDDPWATAAALASADPDARRAALERLAARGAPLDATLALAVAGCLAGPRKDVQRRAVDVLKGGSAAGHEVVLDALRAACSAVEPAHRWGAAYALGQLGRFEPVMLPPLLEALGNEDGDRRWAAAEIVIAHQDAAGPALLPALLAALARPEAVLRKMVLYVLRDLRLDAPDARASVRAALLGAMHDPDVGVRLAALAGLVRLERPPGEAGALVLAMAAHDADPGARRAAVSALGSVGLSMAAARPVLEAAAASDDAGLRRAAAVARRRLGV